MNNKLWGGRFEGDVDGAVRRLNDSYAYDRRLFPMDVTGSMAYACVLGECGVIPSEDAKAIVEGLAQILYDFENGNLDIEGDYEDVHTAVESILTARIGEVAGKLHTGRSRNDQVATDMRLYLRSVTFLVLSGIRRLQETVLKLAEREIDTVLPGYTHLQHAQPVLLAHHRMAYFWMFERDRSRFLQALNQINVLPLGSGALAGCGFEIDRARLAELLEFGEVTQNSMDAVSDRDFALDFLYAASVFGMHLSRFAEEIVIWNSREFGFVELDDSVATGSSLMPQKKNPDVAELARAKPGRLNGNLLNLLTVMKGLPLCYNKDMQEDKEAVFDTVDTLEAMIPAFTQMIETMKFDQSRMLAGTVGDFSTATDVADELVKQGMPFREAHGVVGKAVRKAIDEGISVEAAAGLPESDPKASTGRRSAEGGTARVAVLRQIEKARAVLGP